MDARKVELWCLFLVVLTFCSSVRGATTQRAPGLAADQLRGGQVATKGRAPDIEELGAAFWNAKAQEALDAKLSRPFLTGVARNVIFFLGDGMSIPTLTAARAYLGQSLQKSGEETVLSFEKFPYVGLSKTYCVNSQVADSACSATAYLGGVKGNLGTIGVTGNVKLNDSEAMQNEFNHVDSLARLFQLNGKSTGFVTTTRVTHASPAGLYAHTANRDWECDSDAPSDCKTCTDIASQLVHGTAGRNLKVIMGGGKGKFLPKDATDDEGLHGLRGDGRDLVKEWLGTKQDVPAAYVTNRSSLLNVPEDAQYLLGLFDHDHMSFNMERNPDEKPSLTEMTERALDMLESDPAGYFLFVEGGRIDHAHHETKALKALDETAEFQKAVEAAAKRTDPRDTLIVVTADHAHTMSLSGYAPRGNDILGMAGMGLDQLPYSTLSYANGKGYTKEENFKRHDLSRDDNHNMNYQFPALVPLVDETHGGDDVAIFARGPWAHLFSGVLEQNEIAHIVSYATCVGNGSTVCDD